MLIEMLKQIQKREGLSNSQFAAKLNIHRVSWYRNKRLGVISSDILLRALGIYPELKETFLSQIDKDVADKSAHQSPLRRFLALFLRG